MSIMVGVGKGARIGILIKNAETLERFEKVDTLLVDKTGTLTEGKPRVTAVVAASGFPALSALDEWASVTQRCSRKSVWPVPPYCRSGRHEFELRVGDRQCTSSSVCTNLGAAYIYFMKTRVGWSVLRDIAMTGCSVE